MTPFSRWEKELPKLIADARYTAVGSLKERRLIFDDFCKTSADEHKRSKAERARKSREDFQVLLQEAAIAGTLGEHPHRQESVAKKAVHDFQALQEDAA